ncbi:MAG: prepilin peptidase [Chloroflexi bacterium]|nr:prepilin peptidase [Chloroflexota bacterium]
MTTEWAPVIQVGFAGLIGLFVGSFLNVCIDRIPEGQSLLWPASHCQGCGAPIATYDLMPVINYLWLRGRCRACRAGISWRMPVVELATGIGFAAAIVTWGVSPAAAVAAAYICLGIVLFVIDLERHIIPNVIVYPALLASIALAPWLPARGFAEAVIGASVGFGVLLLIFLLPVSLIHRVSNGVAWVVARLPGHRPPPAGPTPAPHPFSAALGGPDGENPAGAAAESDPAGAELASLGGMGGGDVKLAAVIGAITGWPGVVAALYFAFIIGGGVAGLLVLLRVRRLKEYIPFGPALILGCAVAAFWGERAIRWYLGGRS